MGIRIYEYLSNFEWYNKQSYERGTCQMCVYLFGMEDHKNYKSVIYQNYSKHILPHPMW